LQESPDSSDIHAMFYDTALMQNDLPAMQAQNTWSGGQPATGNIAMTIASSLVQRGQVRAAQEMMDRRVTELREQGHAESAAATAARMALWEAEIGDRMSARQYSALSRKLFRGRSNSILIALALTLAGDGQNGKSITDELEKRFPVDTTVRQITVPLTKAL